MEAPSAYGQEVILVVEDDDDVRAFVSETLRDLNYQVFEAPDAKTAMKLLDREKNIDLLLTDVVLPGQNGRELADAAGPDNRELRCYLMTGYLRANAVVHQGRLNPGVEMIQSR